MSLLRRLLSIIAFSVTLFGCCERSSADHISISKFESVINDGRKSYKKKEDHKFLQEWISRLSLEKSGYLNQFATTAYLGIIDTNVGHAKILISTIKKNNDQQDIESIYLSILVDGNPTYMWTYSVKNADFVEFIKWTSAVWE